jgi:hypothetical protein
MLRTVRLDSAPAKTKQDSRADERGAQAIHQRSMSRGACWIDVVCLCISSHCPGDCERDAALEEVDELSDVWHR